MTSEGGRLLGDHYETGKSLKTRLNQHRRNIREFKDDSALFIHQRDKDHLFDFQGARIVFPSHLTAKRELVESSLIATEPNCNLKPGRYPLCKLSSNIILKTLKINSSSRIHGMSSSPTTVVPSLAPSPAHDSLPEQDMPVLSSNTTPVLPTTDCSSIRDSSPVNIVAQPLAGSLLSNNCATPPVSQRTRSRKHLQQPLVADYMRVDPHSPILQSQARALPYSPSFHLIQQCIPSQHVSPSPIASRVRSRITRQTLPPPSPYRLPSACTGAIPKRPRWPPKSPDP